MQAAVEHDGCLLAAHMVYCIGAVYVLLLDELTTRVLVAATSTSTRSKLRARIQTFILCALIMLGNASSLAASPFTHTSTRRNRRVRRWELP